MPNSLSDKHQTHPRKTINVACSRLKTILNYSTLVEKFTVQISIILYSRGKVWTREKREQLKNYIHSMVQDSMYIRIQKKSNEIGTWLVGFSLILLGTGQKTSCFHQTQ